MSLMTSSSAGSPARVGVGGRGQGWRSGRTNMGDPAAGGQPAVVDSGGTSPHLGRRPPLQTHPLHPPVASARPFALPTWSRARSPCHPLHDPSRIARGWWPWARCSGPSPDRRRRSGRAECRFASRPPVWADSERASSGPASGRLAWATVISARTSGSSAARWTSSPRHSGRRSTWTSTRSTSAPRTESAIRSRWP